MVIITHQVLLLHISLHRSDRWRYVYLRYFAEISLDIFLEVDIVWDFLEMTLRNYKRFYPGNRSKKNKNK